MGLFNLAKASTADMKPTLIPSEYGGVNLIAPSRPEPVYVAPEPMTADDVVKFMGYSSVEQIDEAASIGFPAPTGYRQVRHLGGVRRTPIYDGEKVRAWRERVKRLANL